MVLRVDKEKGYIDLSKRRVSKEDIQTCEERYNKSKLVHSIMRHVAETMGLDLEDLYIHVGWPLYRKYGHAYEAFKIVVTDPDSILDSFTREVKEVGPDGNEDQGILVLTNAVKACNEEIDRYKGKLIVKEPPRAVSERDDKQLAEQLNQLRSANEEVDGDAGSEEEEDTGMGEIDLDNSTGITE